MIIYSKDSFVYVGEIVKSYESLPTESAMADGFSLIRTTQISKRKAFLIYPSIWKEYRLKIDFLSFVTIGKFFFMERDVFFYTNGEDLFCVPKVLPRSTEEKERLLSLCMEKYLNSAPQKKFNINDIQAKVQPKATHKILPDIRKILLEGKIAICLKEDLSVLVPKMYKRIYFEEECLMVVTKQYPLRYRGGTLLLGPYELKIPLVYQIGSDVFSSYSIAAKRILVKVHDFLNSGLFDHISTVSRQCRGNYHPHVRKGNEENGWNSCCFGNYEVTIGESYLRGELLKVLVLMNEFFGSVSRNWYKDPMEFRNCVNLAAEVNNCKDCQLKGKEIIRDGKFKEGMYDFYPKCYALAKEVTAENPTPWIEAPQSISGGISYVPKFSAEEFNEEGYDPEGYSQFGWNRDGFDREGFNGEGLDSEGYNREGLDSSGYDREGFDRDGYSREGFDREGLDREGFDREGLDREGNQMPIVFEDSEFFSDDEYALPEDEVAA